MYENNENKKSQEIKARNYAKTVFSAILKKKWLKIGDKNTVIGDRCGDRL